MFACLRSEVLVWRLIGAACWALVGINAAATAWELASAPAQLILSPWSAAVGALGPSAWWRAFKLALAASVAFGAHAAVVTTVEPQPATGSRLLGAPASAAALLASKVAGRARSAAGALALVAYPAAHAASALLFLLLEPRARGALAGAQGLSLRRRARLLCACQCLAAACLNTWRVRRG